MAEETGRRAPPWEVPTQQQQEPFLLEDDGAPVDVTQFVRFGLNHDNTGPRYNCTTRVALPSLLGVPPCMVLNEPWLAE